MIGVVRTQKDIIEIEKTPLNQYQLPNSTYEYLRQGCHKEPDKIALEYFLRGDEFSPERVSLKNKAIDFAMRFTSGERYAAPYLKFSFSDVWKKINQTANLLNNLGFGKDDVVSLILPNFAETYFCLWGAEAAGIVNPLNPMFEAEIMRDVMNAAGTKILITVGNITGSDIWQKVNSIVDEVPTLEKIIILHGKTPNRKDCIRYWNTIENFNGDSLDSKRQIQASDIASMFHTGGTTGIPKIALHTHANEVTLTWLINSTTDARSDDATLVGLPLFHVNGSLGSGLSSWTRGSSIIMAGPAGYRTAGLFDHFFEVLAYHRISWFSVVPTILSVLLDKPEPKSLDLSALRFVICGAAPLSPEVFQLFQKRFDVSIFEAYGLTEGTVLSSICPPVKDSRVGSIGLRLPFTRMKVVQLDSDGIYLRDCETDEVGTFVIAGPTVFPGYKEAVHNEKIWVEDSEKNTWLDTGDLGRQDRDGYFWITGRTKELIIRGGHNIDPAMIEDVLYQHPQVSMAAAVGRPDPHATELPVAYVSLNDGARVTSEELTVFASENIHERAAIPKQITIISELPLTAVGKIFKPALVWLEVENVFREVLSQYDKQIKIQNIDVSSDNKRGILAKVSIAIDNRDDIESLTKDIKQSLGRLPTQFQLSVN